MGVAGIAAGPHTDLDHHGGLGVLVGVCRAGREDTNGLSINGPDNLFTGPVHGVSVPFVLIVRVVVECTAVVAASVSFAEIVGLHLGAFASKPFPVDFVQIVGLQYGTADNARSRSCLDGVFDLAEHDVPARLDQRPVALLGDGESGTVGIIVCDGSGGRELVGGTRGEVESLVGFAQGSVRGAGYSVVS